MAKEKNQADEKIQGITDLPGVGPSTARALIEAGFGTIDAIAAATVSELSSIGSIGGATAQKIVAAAQDGLNLTFTTAAEVLEFRQNMPRITTGSEQLDGLLGGAGIECGGITELAGEFRTGKTQVAHQLCVTAQLPKEHGGLRTEDGSPVQVIYIDSEGTFRPERIVAMTERWDVLNAEEVLANIAVGRAYNSDHQMVLTDQTYRKSQSEKIGLVVVDSLISHFRAEYTGRGTLAARQQKLNQHIHMLLKLAEVSKIAVIITNQVHAKPDQFFGDPNSPTGGHVVAHASHTRLYLRKSKGDRRIARVLDSPLLPESEAVFSIQPQGVVDP
ncbi:MAG: DNA repair and recombination protein RadA [Candidatus Heimdallarchaeota archaeon]